MPFELFSEDFVKMVFKSQNFLYNVGTKILQSFYLEGCILKIMSNEMLVVSYRDALKSGKDKEWVQILKDEIRRRGLKPFKN